VGQHATMPIVHYSRTKEEVKFRLHLKDYKWVENGWL